VTAAKLNGKLNLTVSDSCGPHSLFKDAWVTKEAEGQTGKNNEEKAKPVCILKCLLRPWEGKVS
jgi:hypothetical protein